jgi:hypothetical protein
LVNREEPDKERDEAASQPGQCVLVASCAVAAFGQCVLVVSCAVAALMPGRRAAAVDPSVATAPQRRVSGHFHHAGRDPLRRRVCRKLLFSAQHFKVSDQLR